MRVCRSPKAARQQLSGRRFDAEGIRSDARMECPVHASFRVPFTCNEASVRESQLARAVLRPLVAAFLLLRSHFSAALSADALPP